MWRGPRLTARSIRVLAQRPPLTLHGQPSLALGIDDVPGWWPDAAPPEPVGPLVDVQLPPGRVPSLVIRGSMAGAWTGPVRVELRGKRDTFAAPLEVTNGSFTAELSLLWTDEWGHEGLAPVAGGYRLWLIDAAGAEEVAELAAELSARLYTWTFNDHFNARLEHHPDGGLWLTVNDSRSLAEIGAFARRQLRARAQKRSSTAPVEEAVYLESFDGLVCACNPRALHTELARRDLGLRFYWGVKDRSVPVPDGATPVTINSAEWWRVRHEARYLVTNNWLHDTFKRRPHQRVLQTWHGTAFKRLALDRPNARTDPGFVNSIQAETARWDLLLAENAYSVEQMRGAYDFQGPIVESGYPRNDLLRSPQANEVRSRLRSRLGITEDQHAVLYAPTWRDDQTAMVDHLEVAQLAEALGERYVILVRGHSRNLRGTAPVAAERVIDVTTYPDVTDLFCVADSCLTDYSSVMFDFTVTGKPVVFFTPDYERYVDELRGSYFDLRQSAPGPVLRRFDETVDALADADGVRQRWDESYRAWTEKFNAWDDGKASVRAADALLAHGA